MQLLWLFSALALTLAVVQTVDAAGGDCALLPAFLEANEEGEPKIAAAMKEECAKSFTTTELTECRKCANKISAAIFSTQDLQEQVTKIYAEAMTYTNNGAIAARFTFLNTMLTKYWGTLDQLKACAEVKETADCSTYMYIDGSDFAPVEGSCDGCKDLIVNEQLNDYLDPYNIESGFFDYKKISAASCDGIVPAMDSCAATCKNPAKTGATLFVGQNVPVPANPLGSCTEGCVKGAKYFLPSAATSNMNDLIYFDKNTLKLSCGANLRVCVSKTECYKPKTEFGIAFLPAYCVPKPPKPFDCAKRMDALAIDPVNSSPVIVVSMSNSCKNVFATNVAEMITCVTYAQDLKTSIAQSVGQPDANRIELVKVLLRGYQLKSDKAMAFTKAEKIDVWKGTYQDFIDC